jgi:hypothetical protein
MSELSSMHGWMSLLGSLAIIAIILTAIGLMLGIVKPGDAMRYIGAIVGIVIVLMLAPGTLARVWSAMSLWQQLGLIAIGIGIIQLLRSRRPTRNRRKDWTTHS